MRLEIKDLRELLQGIGVNVHVHTDPDPSRLNIELARIDQLRGLTKLLSLSTFKLQTALERAGKIPAPPRAQPSENFEMKTPIDQAIAELTRVIALQDTVLQSAIVYIDATPELIQEAYDAGVANGAKPEQLGALSSLIEHLKANSAAVKDALSANTVPDIPKPPVVTVPTITGITPTSGFDGTTIMIAGTGFGSKGSVTLSGQPCEVISYSDTSITTTVPVGSSPGPTEVTVDLVVTPEGGAAVTASFTVTPDPNA